MTRAPFPTSPLGGPALISGLDDRFKQLYDAAMFPLTGVGGTANAVTATLVPALDGDGLLDGMCFTITWGAENTGGMTLALNGGSAVPIVGPDGAALAGGSVEAGLRSLLTYVGGEYVMLSPTLLMGGGGGGASRFSWTFTASGTWTKPDGLPDATPVFIEGWGGGGGGGAGAAGGGGGGAYISRWVRAGDLGATVTVTIGAGGAVGAAGGNSTFGAFLTAYGGGAGGIGGVSPTFFVAGGGGGGTSQAGGNVTSSGGGARGFQGGGMGGGQTVPAEDATTPNGGGGGNGFGSTGGNAVYGGGGGTVAGGAAGVSLYGGNGGVGTAGSAPAGGGGRASAGARGEIRVWI